MATREWHTLILDAQRAGYTVQENPEYPGWTVITPKMYRRASEEHGAFRSQSEAWRRAAEMHHDHRAPDNA